MPYGSLQEQARYGAPPGWKTPVRLDTIADRFIKVTAPELELSDDYRDHLRNRFVEFAGKLKDDKMADGVFMGRAAWTYQDLGVLFHTALRKVCDSTITSVAYNLAHGMHEEWSLLMVVVSMAIRREKGFRVHTDTPEIMAAHLRHLMGDIAKYEEWCYPWHKGKQVIHSGPETRAWVKESRFLGLALTLRMFTEEDMERMVSFCFE